MLIMGFIVSDALRQAVRIRGRLARRGPPTIHYFHQVDDPHSHLAVQKIDALANRYKVRFRFHLARTQQTTNRGMRRDFLYGR